MELKTLPPPNKNQENENIFGTQRKLGPIPQSSSNQYRSPQPDTNPNVRKVNKATEKRKRVVPTKRFRANIAATPNEAAAQPPATIFKSPTDIKIQAQEETSKIDPCH